jgi:peptide-methionine (S)-S-oxide reductase
MTANPRKLLLPSQQQALAGREETMPVDNRHFVHGRPIQGPFPELGEDQAQILLGLGCFWGAERKFWTIPGVYTTAVGYAGGLTKNPTYEEVCSGLTGHTEVVLVVFQPSKVSLQQLLAVFFESHDPTQGMRQGNDVGTQYRSAIYTENDGQMEIAEEMLAKYQTSLRQDGHSTITTEIAPIEKFYYAEQYHQQYLAKNPNGYCGIGGTGVSCSI